MNLVGKKAILVGATGGIGGALAHALQKEGVELVLIGRNERKLSELADAFPGSSTHRVDLRSRTDVDNLLGKLAKSQGIDLLINTAGIGIYKPLLDISDSDWDDSLSINLTIPFLFTRTLAPLLAESSLGLILNIGSGTGVIPMRNRSVYCATKFALRGMTLSLAEEYEGQKPSFCLITLGSTLTEFGPLTLREKKHEKQNGRAYFTPKWVADKLLEIIKNDSRETEYTFFPSDYGHGEWKKP